MKIIGFFKSFVPGILSSGWKCKAAIICSGLAHWIDICICFNRRDAFCFVFEAGSSMYWFWSLPCLFGGLTVACDAQPLLSFPVGISKFNYIIINSHLLLSKLLPPCNSNSAKGQMVCLSIHPEKRYEIEIRLYASKVQFFSNPLTRSFHYETLYQPDDLKWEECTDGKGPNEMEYLCPLSTCQPTLWNEGQGRHTQRRKGQRSPYPDGCFLLIFLFCLTNGSAGPTQRMTHGAFVRPLTKRKRNEIAADST